MKIYDIVTESQILNEQLGTFVQMLEKIIDKGLGVKGLEYALTWISKAVRGKGPAAAEELAEAWIKAAEKMGMSTDDAIKIGSDQAKAAGIADDVILAARETAEGLAKRGRNSVFSKIKDKEQAFSLWYGVRAAQVNKALTIYGIVEPIAECAYNIFQLYEMREQGNPQLQDNAKLSYAVQYYIDECVKRVVTVWAGNKVVGTVLGKWVPGIAYNIPILGKLFQQLDPIYNKITPAAQAAFKVWMATPDGQEALAKWLVGEAMVPNTEWKIPFGQTWQKLVLNPLSGLTHTGYNHILRMIGSDKAAPNYKPDTPSDSPKVLQNYDMTTGRKLDTPKPLN